jgi:ABC-type glycerol-3-phosphate transport system substrate-binding protein
MSAKHGGFFAAFAAIASAATICACGGGRSPAGDAKVTPDSVRPTEAVKLVFQHPYVGAAAAAIEDSVRAFDESRDDLTISIEPIDIDDILDVVETGIPAGKGPDVFIAPDTFAREWITHQNILQPLDRLLKRRAPTLVPADTWNPRFLDRLKAADSIYGLPLAVRVPIVVANPDVMKGGFSFRTVATAKESASALTFVRNDWLAMTGFPPAFGGTVIDGAGAPAFASEAAVRAFRFVVDQIRAGGMVPVEKRMEVTDRFNDGTSDAILIWPDAISLISESRAWTIVPLPHAVTGPGDSGPVAPWWQVDSIFLSSWSRHREAATDLMVWLASQEQQDILIRRDFPGLLTRKAAIPTAYEKTAAMTGLRAQFALCIPSPDLPAVATAARIFGRAVTDLIQAAGSNPEIVEPTLKQAAAAAGSAVTKVMQSSSIRLK